MKFLKIAGLAFVSMLVTGMALAGNAAAVPLWLLCLPWVNSPTKYEDNQCTRANPSANPAWESVALGTRSDTVRLLYLTVTLRDTKATGGSSAIRCDHPQGWGLILNRNLLLIKSATVENPKTECERIEGGCKAGEVEVIEGLHLPWKDELFETENKILSKLEGDGGGGEPGWKIRCNTLLGKTTDECTTESGQHHIFNWFNAVTGGVLLVFAEWLNNSKGTCSLGGAKSWELTGLFAILLWNGLGLSLNRV